MSTARRIAAGVITLGFLVALARTGIPGWWMLGAVLAILTGIACTA